MMVQKVPNRNPATTCSKVCFLSTILLVPTSPPMRMTMHIHHTGLKENILEKAMMAPNTPPMAAECTQMCHHLLMMAQSICMTIAEMMMHLISYGIYPMEN